MKIIRFLFLICAFVSFSAKASEDACAFSPAPGVKAVVTIDKQSLSWTLDDGAGKNQDLVDIETEKSIHVDINDYDFSGNLGFAVWHLDDGMGAYSIYRVFTFSASQKRFIERSPGLQCGDEFLNLKVDKNGRRLVSTVWDKNIPKTCSTCLSPTK